MVCVSEVQRDLAGFSGLGYDKGRPAVVQALWFAAQNLLFAAWWFPASLRPKLLRLFGASVGEDVFIRHRVRVLWPWKLCIGDHTWIGEGAWLLNLEPIEIGNDVCISQEAFLCTGSHDVSSPTFEYDNAPIRIEECAWIGARSMVLRGVTIGRASVVSAGARVSKDVPPQALVRYNGSLRSGS